jgi:hypothetical protein
MAIVFLLGAGASKKAGVPLVDAFVTEFKQSLGSTQPSSLELLDRLEARLRNLNPERVVDVELILETVEASIRPSG